MTLSVLCLSALLQTKQPWEGNPVWRDEFSGTKLDTTKWQAIDQVRTAGESEWKPDLVSVEGGNLKFKIRRNPDKLPRYSSGAVRTRKDYDINQTLFGPKFGYLEAKVRLPKNLKTDAWFAWWIMGGSITDNQTDTRKGTEIDIVESFRAFEGKSSHNLHWGGYGATHNHAGSTVDAPQISDGKFHTYGLYWTPSEYVFYVDRKETWRTNAVGLGQATKVLSQGPCLEPGYLKLSVEAATWSGPTNGWDMEGPEADDVLIDYVRVWPYKV